MNKTEIRIGRYLIFNPKLTGGCNNTIMFSFNRTRPSSKRSIRKYRKIEKAIKAFVPPMNTTMPNGTRDRFIDDFFFSNVVWEVVVERISTVGRPKQRIIARPMWVGWMACEGVGLYDTPFEPKVIGRLS